MIGRFSEISIIYHCKSHLMKGKEITITAFS